MHRSLDQKKPHLLIMILLNTVHNDILHIHMLYLDILDFEHDVMTGQDFEDVSVGKGGWPLVRKVRK